MSYLVNKIWLQKFIIDMIAREMMWQSVPKKCLGSHCSPTVASAIFLLSATLPYNPSGVPGNIIAPTRLGIVQWEHLEEIPFGS